MKSINAPNTDYGWKNDLIKDLSFIKEKKRYPISKRTFAPSLALGLFLLVTTRLFWGAFVGLTSKSVFVPILVGLLMVALVAITAYNYFQTLVFKVTSANKTLTENTKMLHTFFRKQNLAYTQHPEAPEVFMIISRNLNANNSSKNEYREVMVFIADDNRILVNGHFSGKKFSITPPSGNYKKMAKELSLWIDSYISNTNNTNVPIRSF